MAKVQFTKLLITSIFFAISQAQAAAPFREYPIGDEIERDHLKIAAVYFPAVPMDHSKMGHGSPQSGDSAADIAKEKFVKPGQELIHVECDIHSLTDNPAGFAAGEWIPYLTVKYKLTKRNGKTPLLEGELMPMIAKDGPHYGTTLRMPGKGKYVLSYTISAPALARHTDSLTGVGEYWKSFEATFDFDYQGIPQ